MLHRAFAAAALGAVVLAAAPVGAQTFNFDAVPVGTSTPFSVTSGGLTANFNSTAPAGYTVLPNVFNQFQSFSGNFLASLATSNALTVGLSALRSTATFNFATNDRSTLTLTLLRGATVVGTVSGVGTVPNGFVNPEGVLSFSGAAFDNISIVSSNPTTQFAIDNLVFGQVAVVPEPGTVALVGAGLLAVGGAARRRRARTG